MTSAQKNDLLTNVIYLTSTANGNLVVNPSLSTVLGTFTITYVGEHATLMDADAEKVTFSIPSYQMTIQNSCLIDSISIIDTELSQTLSTLKQVGFQDETSLEWKLMNDQTYTNRKDTSYVCPAARIAITLVSMVYPDGSS